MIAIASESAGILLLPRDGTDDYLVLDLVQGMEMDSSKAQYIYSMAQDWSEIEGPNSDVILLSAKKEYWILRVVSLFRHAIGGLECSLEKRVFNEIEEILGSHASPNDVLNRLLIAPLSNPNSPHHAAESALSGGFTTAASILDELIALQPLINRFTDKWLTLPAIVFSNFSEPKEIIWRKVVEMVNMKHLLLIDNKRNFINQWNLLSFNFNSVSSRFGVKILGNSLSQRLFPDFRHENESITPLLEEKYSQNYGHEKREINGYEKLGGIIKQISVIAQAVSVGQDFKAEKFLKELIEEQTSSSSDKNYVVKSLCNIAQQCADMLRIDFEAICLDEAFRVDPHDTWTLIQRGDHLKRMGKFKEALDVFAQAEMLGEIEVSKSSAADVYSRQGDYAKAILTYKTISGWEDNLLILTAIADNLRRIGHLNESEKSYRNVIERSLIVPELRDGNNRALAGLAEIAKQRGNLQEAEKSYNEILALKNLDERDRRCYKLALCNILKSMGKLGEAFTVADEVIQLYPFSVEARFLRGSILGLIGRELEGLEDFPESRVTHSSREWLRYYYRGLLLFKLGRYDEAKKNLIDEFPKAIASGEEMVILRLAATLCYLREQEIISSDELLSQIPQIYDCKTEYLSLVLRLHSAMLKKDQAAIISLKSKISTIKTKDSNLLNAFAALKKKNFILALNYETDALLSLAA